MSTSKTQVAVCGGGRGLTEGLYIPQRVIYPQGIVGSRSRGGVGVDYMMSHVATRGPRYVMFGEGWGLGGRKWGGNGLGLGVDSYKVWSLHGGDRQTDRQTQRQTGVYTQ